MSENKQCSSSSCDKKSCEGCSSAKKNTIPKEELNAYSAIKKVVGVVSGKGGVGKSFVTASLANEMAAKGYRVGILDADITGPSIPRMYGLKGAAMADDNGIYPMLTENDIKIMSINLLLPQEDSPVIWRGPVIANMVNGIVIVSSPQDLVQMIVKKAYNMAEMMKIPVVGLVENYSFVKCPDCGKSIYVFGESKADEIGAELNIPVMAKMPLDPNFASMVDAGKFAEVRNEYLSDAVKCLPRA